MRVLVVSKGCLRSVLFSHPALLESFVSPRPSVPLALLLVGGCLGVNLLDKVFLIVEMLFTCVEQQSFSFVSPSSPLGSLPCCELS